MEQLKFHRIPESKLPKWFKTHYRLLRVLSVKHLLEIPRLDKVFKIKGTKCINPLCKNEGYYITLALSDTGTIVAHLLTKDLILMTRDHIIPTSKGGGDTMDNWQPMCEPCNKSKGNYYVPPIVHIEPKRVVQLSQVEKFEERYRDYTTKRINKLLLAPVNTHP